MVSQGNIPHFTEFRGWVTEFRGPGPTVGWSGRFDGRFQIDARPGSRVDPSADGATSWNGSFFLGDVDGRRRRAPRQTLRHRAAVRAERRGGDAAGQVGQRVVDRRLRRPQSHLQVHHPEARRAGQRTRARHGQRRLDHRSGQRVQRRPLGGAVGAQGRRRLPVPRQLRQQRRRGPAVRAEQPRHPAPRR